MMVQDGSFLNYKFKYMESSNKYKLMIYFAHSTMVMYAKTIVSHDKMTPHDFMEQNKDVIQRVFDEGLSIMEYELSHNQLLIASYTYLNSKYHPSSVYETEIFVPKKDEVELGN
jgi:hypothetical protein